MRGWKRFRNVVVGSVAALTLALGGIAAVAAAGGDPSGAASIDDGASLLPLANITLEQAITAAQASASGAIGEIDIEYYEGTLVFNVDVGDQDVKVDATTGAVIGMGAD